MDRLSAAPGTTILVARNQPASLLHSVLASGSSPAGQCRILSTDERLESVPSAAGPPFDPVSMNDQESDQDVVATLPLRERAATLVLF